MPVVPTWAERPIREEEAITPKEAGFHFAGGDKSCGVTKGLQHHAVGLFLLKEGLVHEENPEILKQHIKISAWNRKLSHSRIFKTDNHPKHSAKLDVKLLIVNKINVSDLSLMEKNEAKKKKATLETELNVNPQT